MVASLGDTIRFTVMAADKRGATVGGVVIRWSSDDPGIVSVDDRGQAVARAPGSTTIIAAVGSHVGRARVVIRQSVAHVRILSDGAIRLGEDERRRVDVHATDARGFVINGRQASWRVTDPSVGVVDSIGNVTGLAAGTATLVAVIDGIAAESPITVAAVPGSVILRGDSGLRALSGRQLPHSVTVHVNSRRDHPAADLLVRFFPEDGHGHVDRDSARTDRNGNTTFKWTLGTAPGRQHLAVTVDGLDSIFVVTAEAEPVAENTRYVGPGAALTGRAGDRLEQPVTIRLTDTLGRAVADVPVAWKAEADGAVEVLDARTDTLGEARARWTLGPKSGKQRIRVQAGPPRAVPPFYVTASAVAGAPASAVVVSGGAQTARVGDVLGKRIRVRVHDAVGNPVAGARVMAMAAAGTTSDTLLLTDSTGAISIRWTLGTAAGPQQLLVRPEGIAQALTVSAMARPRTPANVEFIRAPSSGIVGRALVEPIKVVVTDAYGNAIPDAQVIFAARAGTATPRSRMTDAGGAAIARWTLGQEARAQALVASVPRTNARAQLTIDARAVPSPAVKGKKPTN
ncbi:MAG: Ig-like domain-containing protein [Gemmatimonadaceae bacterium]